MFKTAPVVLRGAANIQDVDAGMPEAAYISRLIPKLRTLLVALRFAPWTQPERAAQLAPDYPARPMVDLAYGREAALAAYRRSAPGEPR